MDLLGQASHSHPHGRPAFKELLFELGLGDFDFDSLVYLLGVTASVICVVLDCCGEEGVDEGRLSKA